MEQVAKLQLPRWSLILWRVKDENYFSNPFCHSVQLFKQCPWNGSHCER